MRSLWDVCDPLVGGLSRLLRGAARGLAAHVRRGTPAPPGKAAAAGTAPAPS